MTFGKFCAFAMVLAVAACGSGDAGKMKKVKDEICACKDMDCVKKVEKDSEDLKKAMMEKFKDAKGPEDIPKELIEISLEMDECRRKIRKEERESKKGEEKKSDEKEGQYKMKPAEKKADDAEKKADDADKKEDKKADEAAEHGGDDGKELLAKMKAVTEKVCGCSDIQCVQATSLEMAEVTKVWSTTMAGKHPSVGLVQEMSDVTKQYGECVKKASGIK